MQASSLYEFGPYRLDAAQRLLTRAGESVTLAPKTFDLLLILVESGGRVLTKQDLMNALWPDTFVEEANLPFQVSGLRKALGDEGSRWIETLPKHGYRFNAQVTQIGGDKVRRGSADGNTNSLTPTPAQATPHPEYQVQSSGHRLRVLTLLSVAGLSVFAAGFVISRFSTAPVPPTPLQFTPLVVDTNLKLFPAWSPNGRTVAYAGEAKGKLQIFTRTLGAPLSTQITDQANDCFLPFWSPTGERIYYLAYPGSDAVSFDSQRYLWSVGAAGGVPELIHKNVNAATISPDGRTLAMLRRGQAMYPAELWLASPPTAEPKKYTTNPFAALRYQGNGDLHFSPDGSKLAVSVILVEGRTEIWILPMAGKPYLLFPSTPLSEGLRTFSWMPDGQRLVFSNGFIGGSNQHLFLGDMEHDRIWPVTGGPAAEQAPSVSPDGRTVAISSMEGAYDLVEVPLDGSGIRSLGSTPRNEVTPSWSPLGGRTYAYATDRTGIYEIWLRNETDGSERPLVTQKDFGSDKTALILDVKFSPDGQRIAYRRVGDKDESIWISTIAGDPPVRLAREPGGVFQRGPSWSPDGNWIAYYSTRNERSVILKAKVGGTGTPVLLRNDVETYPRWSPDGKWLLCGTSELWIISADGETRRSISERQWTISGWSRDGAKIFGIRTVEGRRVVLAEIDVRSGVETRIANLGPYSAAFAYGSLTAMIPFRGFSLSPDGRSFLS